MAVGSLGCAILEIGSLSTNIKRIYILAFLRKVFE